MLVTALERVFGRMAASGHAMFVVQGLRTLQQQQVLYARGRTSPGAIVTMKDGVKHPSDHQAWSDGYGHAADCAFLGPNPAFGPFQPWEDYGKACESEGLTWGGRWSHPHDAPHVQLGTIRT